MTESAASTKRVPNRLVLCFDGTGNSFSGTSSDTNIVKLYQKFKRDDPHQYHYYQTGIGTYTIEGGSINTGWLKGVSRSCEELMDQAFGTTFDAHVVAGYRFLMRYYDDDDLIYMFGFSRGAYTARFLARMVSAVGILSRGNEEMIPFAYKLYQDYEMGKYNLEEKKGKPIDVLRRTFQEQEQFGNKVHDQNPAQPEGAEGSRAQDLERQGEDDDRKEPEEIEFEKKQQYLTAFRETFCRFSRLEDIQGTSGNQGMSTGIKVHFLGLFDTVNSVGILENPFETSVKPPKVHGTARHVRHAVAVDERRVKFRPALLAQDELSEEAITEDVKEVWFAGNHGDVGGGWPAVNPSEKPATKMEGNSCQMSDITLAWMIRELEKLPYGNNKLTWNGFKGGFKRRLKERLGEALQAKMHDTLRFGFGLSWSTVILWNVMEYLPISRWELVKSKSSSKAATGGDFGWKRIVLPVNGGGTRDIPAGAVLHNSLKLRLESDIGYRPPNQISLDRETVSKLCELDTKRELKLVQDDAKDDEIHKLWTISR